MGTVMMADKQLLVEETEDSYDKTWESLIVFTKITRFATRL
jgi:hypothetical protein